MDKKSNNFLFDFNIDPSLNCNDNFAKLSFKQKHGWVIMTHSCFVPMWLVIQSRISAYRDLADICQNLLSGSVESWQ